ncbi:nucleotidyltransferase family protein [Sulfitobacter sp.]|uniref:nucleotidyltransferase family protein n=1 Tax=Sulfitobacter sp. TaxID=1903071 RepID=UPI004059E04E
MSESLERQIAAILHRDAVRWRLLGVVSHLELPDCWIAAGFIRNAVWDALHGRSPQMPNGDVDVICFDPDSCFDRIDGNLNELLDVRPGTDPQLVHLRANHRVCSNGSAWVRIGLSVEIAADRPQQAHSGTNYMNGCSGECW